MLAVARETLSIVATASGIFGDDEDSKENFCVEALATWLQAHDAAASEHLDAAAATALEALDADCYAVTGSLSDCARMPSLAPLFAGCSNKFDFTVPGADAWDVCLQVAMAQFAGRPCYFVGSCEAAVDAARALGFTTASSVGELRL